MRLIEFPPLGAQVPQVGLGCGRLVGRASLCESARVVEAALDLGIRYFDVAPLYGLGTAEEVLGHVLHGVDGVVVASKVGIPRPSYRPVFASIRRMVKPALDRAGGVKSAAMRLLARPRPQDACPPFRFTEDVVRRTVEESLRLLRRDRLDVLLAHDPRSHCLGAEEDRVFRTMVTAGLARCYGVGTEATLTPPLPPFGSVWQSKWPGQMDAARYPTAPVLAFHGIVRSARESVGPVSRAHPGELVRMATESAPKSMIIVSASTPQRLKELLSR